MSLRERKAGILLHPTSLPGGELNGDFGKDAFEFVDFIAQCGFKLWQVLPLGPTHEDNSPYQCLSAHAGDLKLISVERLAENSWVDESVYQQFLSQQQKLKALDKSAYLRFFLSQFESNADENEKREFNEFSTAQSYWLEDYALFVVLRKKHQNLSWTDWPSELREREQDALSIAKREYCKEIVQVEFEQFCFFQQWMAIKSYANEKNIQLFGDIPLFVAHDSADVWAHRDLFKLDEDGHSRFIAGVPPDYFSETGQRWGNPLYSWEAIVADDYLWWIKRLETQFSLFDLVRIDHFRGLESYWEIPAEHETAINGYWVTGPGYEFFNAIKNKFGEELPLVAEDLGLITKEVDDLRKKVALPGMKILQFAFDSDSQNPYLPHNHEIQSVVYTGTHDNDTSLGWYQKLAEPVKVKMHRYYGESPEVMPWLLIRSVFSSVAQLAVVPMQDIMSLDSSHRMNIPGTIEGNWSWRFDWQDVDKKQLAERVQEFVQLYSR